MSHTGGEEEKAAEAAGQASPFDGVRTIQFKPQPWTYGAAALMLGATGIIAIASGILSNDIIIAAPSIIAGIALLAGTYSTAMSNAVRLDGRGVTLKNGRRLAWDELRRIERSRDHQHITMTFSEDMCFLDPDLAEDSIELARFLQMVEAHQANLEDSRASRERARARDRVQALEHLLQTSESSRDESSLKLPNTINFGIRSIFWDIVLGTSRLAVALGTFVGILGVAADWDPRLGIAVGIIGLLLLPHLRRTLFAERRSLIRQVDMSGITVESGLQLPWSEFQRLRPSRSGSPVVLEFAQGHGTLDLAAAKSSPELLQIIQVLHHGQRTASIEGGVPPVPAPALEESVEPPSSPWMTLIHVALFALGVFVVAKGGLSQDLRALMLCGLLSRAIAAMNIRAHLALVLLAVAMALYSQSVYVRLPQVVIHTGVLALLLLICARVTRSTGDASVLTFRMKAGRALMTLGIMFAYGAAGSALACALLPVMGAAVDPIARNVDVERLSGLRFEAGLATADRQILLLGMLVAVPGLFAAARWLKPLSQGVAKWLPHAGAGLAAVAALVLLADGALAKALRIRNEDWAKSRRDEFRKALHAADEGRRRMVAAAMVEDALNNLAPQERTDLRAFLKLAAERGDGEALIEPLGLWLAQTAPDLPATQQQEDAIATLAQVRAWVTKQPFTPPAPYELGICRAEASRFLGLSRMAELNAEEALLRILEAGSDTASGALSGDFIRSLVALLSAKYRSREPWTVHDLDSARAFARSASDPARRWEWRFRRAGTPRDVDSETAMSDVVARVSQAGHN
ncbi:hypothetical protein [Sorangium sp. So ce341]|uniref:hypothetical protein n=1 Tax=Sorangium sp. So ce341 TaxID=3133302 RepID=UPI003F6092E3